MGRKKKDTILFICPVCKNQIMVLPWFIKFRKFCNRECYKKREICNEERLLKSKAVKIRNARMTIEQKLELNKKISQSHLGKKIPKLSETRKRLIKEGKIIMTVGFKKGKENISHRPDIRKMINEARLNWVVPKRDTKPERIIQEHLDKLNIKYHKHKVIRDIEHKYQCDIFVQPNIVIECDGDYWHDYPNLRDIDKIRNTEMIQKGYKVLRFWERDILSNPINCVERIKNEIW